MFAGIQWKNHCYNHFEQRPEVHVIQLLENVGLARLVGRLADQFLGHGAEQEVGRDPRDDDAREQEEKVDPGDQTVGACAYEIVSLIL